MFRATQSRTRRAILALYNVAHAIIYWKANQISGHAVPALMSSRSPLAASPLTTLLVSPLTSFLLGPCFNVRSSTSLLGGLFNCIGVFGNVVRSSGLNVGVLDHSTAFVPLPEPSGVLFDIVDDCGGPFSSSMGIYLAEYAVGKMVGMGMLLRSLTAGFLCCVARALAAAMIPSGLARLRLDGCGGSSGEEGRGCSSRENGLLIWLVCTL
jgi:hypothetical protein